MASEATHPWIRGTSPHLHPIFLRKRWNDTVQAQVLDELSIVIGDVPDGANGDTGFGVAVEQCLVAAE